MVARTTSRGGFSLLEIIVALVLLSVGMLAVAGTGVVAARLLKESTAEEAVLTAANSVLDSLLQLSDNTAAHIEHVGYRIEWNAADSSARIRVRVTRAGKPVAELPGIRP